MPAPEVLFLDEPDRGARHPQDLVERAARQRAVAVRSMRRYGV
jgi:hypothetical protein